MPDQKRKGGPLNTVHSIGRAALAVGAGAALLYRSGGASVLSDGVLKAGKLINTVSDDIAGMARKEFDAKTLTGLYQKHIAGEDSTWKTLGNKYNGSIKIDQQRDNLFSTLINKMKLEEDVGLVLSNKYNEQVQSNLMLSLASKHNQAENETIQGTINNLVKEVFKRTDDAVLYKDLSGDLAPNLDYFSDKFKHSTLDPQAQHEIMEEILGTLKNKGEGFSEFKLENEDLVRNITGKFNLEELAERYGKKGETSFSDRLMGDVQATVNDLIANEEKILNKEFTLPNQDDPKNMIDVFKALVEKDPGYGDLYVDKLLRVNQSGDVTSLVPGKDLINKATDEFANTLPGKLFKTRDFLYKGDSPSFKYFSKNSSDPTLRAVESAKGILKGMTEHDYVKVLDKVYKVSDQELEHVAELDGNYLTSGRHGTSARLMKNIAGDSEIIKGKNGLLSKLDIGNTPSPSKLKEVSSVFTKFKDERYGRNLMDSFMFGDGLDKERVLLDPEYLKDEYNRMKKLDKFLSETTNNLDKKTVRQLMDVSSGKTKQTFGYLLLPEDEMIEELVKKKNLNDFYNSDLTSLIKKYKKDPKSAVDMLKVSSDRNMIFGETKPIKFSDMIKKEVAKEAFMSEIESSGGRNSLVNLFNNSGVSGQALKEAKYLSNWAAIQNYTKAFSSNSSSPQHVISMIDTLDNMDELFKSTQRENSYSVDGSFLKDFRENLQQMAKEKAAVTQKGFQRAEIAEEIIDNANYGEWMLMKKAVSPLAVLNDATKAKAFAKQFTAGRKNMADVTTATLYPYFSVARVIDPLAAVGLGFSAKSTRDVMDLSYNLMVKRVAPIAAGAMAISYLDYEAKNLTGTSLRGAAANSLANMDLGARKIADITGIGKLLEEDRKINPMAQYIWGDDYQDSNERRDWYQNGYSEVRKGRFWSFGSSSEMRGGKIDYFQHNYLKRAHSDWKDIGVYGSTKDKWSHSLMPTLRHPLSTLKAVTNPYWLEKKNYWDRPYPVSGKMFEDGTPWGAILNPTVGAIIKPQKQMHKRELGRSMIDVRDLIAARNKSTMDKANRNTDLINISGEGRYEPSSFTPLSNPTGTEGHINMNISGGKIRSMALGNPEYSGTDIHEYEQMHDAVQSVVEAEYGGTGGIKGGSKSPASSYISFTDRIKISSASGGIFGSVVSKLIPSEVTAGIRYENQKIFDKAENAVQPAGVITPDAIFKTKAKHSSELLYNAEALSDMRNITTTNDFLRDAGYSAKELSGMHGFLFEQVFPSQSRNVLQSADRMDSFSRSFWDNSVGGLGGEFMEIARRFFPHENHKINRINTIRNTMPDWMPGMFRHGDPYEKIPKGEMRLPGAGYEDINTVNSDEFGKYGAYDRMKILADVAPWSKEYKVWRDIATKTVVDPELRENMKDIRERVIKQSKVHDFQPYRFIGSKLSEDTGIVDSIEGNKFTIVGSSKEYKMAGIGALKDNEETGVGVANYLQKGMDVRFQYDKNDYTGTNPDGTVNAIIYKGKENINRKLLDSEIATERDDTSAAGVHSRFTKTQVERGKIYEGLAHLPIPFVHDKFMRVNSPLESYKSEQIYGSSYSTWSHPIQGFLLPAIQKAWAIGPVGQLAGVATWGLAEAVTKSGASPTAKIAVNALWAATNRGAFVGGTVGFISKLGGSNTKQWMKFGARAGSVASLTGYALTRIDQPVASIFNFAAIGSLVGKQLWDTPGKGALVGAAAGFALSGGKNALFDKDKMFGVYIPDRTKKKWDLEEYYDRLKYMKYTGLYEKAARLAKRKEDTDIKRILNKIDYNQNKREKIRNQLLASEDKVRNTYAEGDPEKEALLNNIGMKLAGLNDPSAVITAGKYTKAALAYKQAAESTIFGMKDNATWSQMLRAVPKNERDYILEFAKERDPKKRKDIMKHISPYQRKVLQIAWGEKPDELKSNSSYFANHKLPGSSWSGWNPSIDLDNVKIKTIQNEGMLLSDFGVYESQLDDSAVINAPEIKNISHNQSGLELRKNLLTALNGAGLTGVDVSLEPSSDSGIQVVANIARETGYKMKQMLNIPFGRTYY